MTLSTHHDPLHRLEQYFAARAPMAIAVSGGVDSMTLAVVAHRIKSGTQVFHAISPAVPSPATARVQHYAAKEGWNLQLIDAGEVKDPQYVANPVNRCYFCKTSLYGTVTRHTPLSVASGTNLDDLADYRPGLVAAEEHQVSHPYVEVGIDKAGLRGIAGVLGLDDLRALPASPCLSSRVTTGIAIDAAMLPVIHQAEEAVWHLLGHRLRLQGVRCRVRQSAVAIQLQTDDTLDTGASCLTQVISLVRELFVAGGYSNHVRHVVFEPYTRGSAFLIDSVEVK